MKDNRQLDTRFCSVSTVYPVEPRSLVATHGPSVFNRIDELAFWQSGFIFLDVYMTFVV